jgi:class III poly(R)-hydroxyalkanoic acid synthase PhaE subunit
MQGNAPFFDTWLKVQQDFVNTWVETTKNAQKMFTGFMPSGEGQPGGEVFNLYNAWVKTMDGSFGVIMKNFPGGTGKDTVSKLFRGFDTYIKLYDFWMPMVKAMQDKALNPEAYKDMADPKKYKEAMDKIFGFATPEAMNQFFGEATKLVDTWGSAAQDFVKPWAGAMQKNSNAFSDLAALSDPNASMNMFHNLYGAFEGTIGKAFKIPPVGKDREKVELMLKTLDKYSVYTARNVEFQHKMYITGQDAMQKVVDTIAKKVKDGEEIKSYNEFFKIWTDVNEKEFYALFKTEEFSRVQAQVLESALDFRRNFHILIEQYLSDFPVPVRSEMNDVYKTIYDLKKRVRTLEKKLNG